MQTSLTLTITLTSDSQNEWRCKGRQVVTMYHVQSRNRQTFCQ